MRINIVLPHQLPFPPTKGGGVEKLNWILAREFARAGHEVVAYSRLLPGLAAEKMDGGGIRHVRVPGADFRPNRFVDHANALRYMMRIRRRLMSGEVTQSHTPFSFVLRRLRQAGTITHTIHRTPKAQIRLYRHLDRVYCGSDAVLQQAQRIGPELTNLKRIFNCIVLDGVPAGNSEPRREGLRFLYLGRFARDKGLESLIRGFAMSLKTYPGNKLITLGAQKSEMGGDTEFFEEMCALVSAKGLGRSVEMLPAVFDAAELEKHAREADVFCMPSLSGETFSMAVLEAMALGKPLLVSDFGPMVEAVEHGVNGFVARAGDKDSLAAGIEWFAGKWDRLGEMGAVSLAKVTRQFSATVIAGEYLADFELLAKRRQANGVHGN